MRIFFVTDNKPWFEKINSWRTSRTETIEIYCSPKGAELFKQEIDKKLISPKDLKTNYEGLLNEFDIGISCHCKQIFPENLVNGIDCFNFHPGLNPYNRGWFPQVFSILNGLPVGATIHKMDSEIDHGPIIAQRPVSVNLSDTSQTVYDRIIKAEFELFQEWVDRLIVGDYRTFLPGSEGNYNSIADFKKQCQIDRSQKVSFGEALDFLRAMTFDGYDNAYFYDENGEKVFVSLNVKKY